MADDGQENLVVLDPAKVVIRRKRGLGGVQYAEALAKEICEVVAASDESLDKICRRMAVRGWPTETTIYAWRLRHMAFRRSFQVAQEIRANRWMHQLVAISDDESRDLIDIGEGRMVPNNAAVARDRLRIDARERAAKRMDPQNWGDRKVVDEPPRAFTPLDDAIHLLD